MDQQQSFRTKFENAAEWLGGQKSEERRVDAVSFASAGAGRRQEHFFVVALNDMGAALLQPRHDVVGELIFEDAVAEAEQLIDIAHRFEGQIQSLEIAMKI